MTGRATALERAFVLRDVLLKHGVPQVSIELQPGRPVNGDEWNACNPVQVTSHHIASRPTRSNPTPGLSLVKRGRVPDLPGPLANGTAGVDLVYRIICMGLANHPGVGGPLRVDGPVGAFVIPRSVGRPYMWGTEYEGGFDNRVWDEVYTNEATGKKMSFREFMGRCNAGLVEGIWLINGHGKKPTANMDLATYHGEHKTWAPDRKIDRLDYSTQSGQAEIRKWAPYTLKETLPANAKGEKKVVLRNVQRAAKGTLTRPTPSVRRVQRTLNKVYPESPIKVDGLWGKETTRRYKHHQKKIGSAPEYIDGIPGLKDLMALGGHRWSVNTN